MTSGRSMSANFRADDDSLVRSASPIVALLHHTCRVRRFNRFLLEKPVEIWREGARSRLVKGFQQRDTRRGDGEESGRGDSTTFCRMRWRNTKAMGTVIPIGSDSTVHSSAACIFDH
jgi:hypothetical protein